MCCKEDTFPLHLNGRSTGSGLVGLTEAAQENRVGVGGVEAEDLFPGSFPSGLAATSAQGNLLHSAPLTWSDDIRPQGGQPSGPALPLVNSLNPAPSLEHNLFIQHFSDHSI